MVPIQGAFLARVVFAIAIQLQPDFPSCGMIIPRMHRSPARAEMFVGVWLQWEFRVILGVRATEDVRLQIGTTRLVTAIFADRPRAT